MKLATRNHRTDDLVEGRAQNVAAKDAAVARVFHDMRALSAEATPEPNAVLASLLAAGRPAAASPINLATHRPRPARPRAWLAGIAVACGTAVFGTMAAAGALPAPVQRAIADAVAHVGVHIPGATVRHHSVPRQGHPPTPATGSDATTPTTSRGSAPTTASPSTTAAPGVTLPTVPPTAPGGSTLPTVPTLPTLPTLPTVPVSPTIPSP